MSINMHAFKTGSKNGKHELRGVYSIEKTVSSSTIDTLPLEREYTLYEQLSAAEPGNMISFVYNNVDPDGPLPVKAIVTGVNHSDSGVISDVWIKEILN